MLADGVRKGTGNKKSSGVYTHIISALNLILDDQWRYSPDRALASLTGFMIVYSTMWDYQLHDRPVLDT
jgi:hypothetical protein